MKLEMQERDKQTIVKSTQSFLKIAEIRNDTVVLQDGTMRAVLNVSSTNFDLKSPDEQNSIIYSYQRFLNSLEHPVQVLMQSRRMDVSNYTEKLKRIAEKQTNELLRIQTVEYIEFINRLVENASVMNKNFYIVVPLGKSITPPASGFFSRIFGGGKAKETAARIQNFEKNKVELDNRVSSIIANLSSSGIRSVRLKTEELIQLYYNSYNFEAGPLIEPDQLKDIKMVE